MKQALVISTVSGFLLKFEKENVKLLQELGYEVHYAANMDEPFYSFRQEELTALGVRGHHISVARSPFMLGWNARALHTLVQIVRSCSINLIHCHEPMGGVLGRLVSALVPQQKIQVVYTAHGFHFYEGAPLVNRTVYYCAERILARLSDAIVLINQEDYAAAQQLRLKQNGKVWLIPGAGLDLDAYMPPDSQTRERFRQKHGIAGDCYLLLSVGELNENKNHQVMLQALKLLKDRGLLPDHLRYGICGYGFLRDKLGEMIRNLGLSDVVQLYGYCTEIREYLAMADAMAFPSLREGLGMAALEALAMGIPVLAADNRGTREYMLPGVNGYVCGPDDAAGFAEHLLRLLDLAPEARARMSRQCRESVNRFSSVCTAGVMKQVYRELDERVEQAWAGRR